VPEARADHEHDDVLGRAFDRRLTARLWDAARPHHRLVWSSIALFPLIALVELAQPYLLKVAIDDHILQADWVGLSVVATLYAATLLLLYGLRMVEAYLMALTGQGVIHDLRQRLFAHLVRLEAAFFDRTPVGRLMTRVLNDVEAVSEAFTSGLFAIVADVVTLAGVVAVMLWIDWRLGLVTFAIVPVVAAVAAFFRLRARDAYREVRRSRTSGASSRAATPSTAARCSAPRSTRPRCSPPWRRWARSRWRRWSGTAAAGSWTARSASASWSRSCSTPTASSCPSAPWGPSTP
jgi:ABC-type multidrug transport system fused ATPase/permease subunit